MTSSSASSFILKNPYDSHVHWEATGAFAKDLNLSMLKSAGSLREVQIKSDHRRGMWILGYHWDESTWPDQPSRQILDEWAGDQPVLLERVDRHAAWVNTKALEIAGLLHSHSTSVVPGGVIEIDREGFPTGVVKDRAMDLIKSHIPPKSITMVEDSLQRGAEIFHRGGFTHIRDLTCDPVQWEASRRLEKSGELRLAVEQYFDVLSEGQLEEVLHFLGEIRNEPRRLVRLKGIKLFYDGALGSEGAWLSRPYYGCGQNFGFTLYEKPVLQSMIQRIWNAGFEVAVHTIGDQAAHDVVEIALNLWGLGLRGRLNLEHAELLRPETIQMMKGRDVVCHLQPCHWLTDKAWTDKKLGPLTKYLFRWRELEELGVPFTFGSDAPIEPSSLELNHRALMDASRYGIPLTQADWTKYVVHPDSEWVKGCECHLLDGSVVKTTFSFETVHVSGRQTS